MDLNVQRLNQGEKIAAGSALALFVCMFLGWFNFGVATANAWDSLHYASPILAVVIAATLTIAFLKASGTSIGDIPGGSAIFALGCVATLLVLFRLIDPISLGDASPFGGSGEGEVSSSVEAGLFLGLVAAAGIAVGGYLATSGRALDQVKGLFAAGGASTPQAPPPLAGSAPVPPPASPQAPAAPPAEPVEQAPLPSVQQASPPAPEPPLPPVQLPASGEGQVFCEHCGSQLGANDRFCGGCGQPAGSQ